MSELQQVIVCVILCRNRFLQPGMFVNSSTVPYCIAMERQKQNVRVCAQNLVIFRNDGERNDHIDDDEQTAATTNDREEQSTMYSTPKQFRQSTMRWCWSHVRALDFPQISTPKFHTRQRRKGTNMTTKQTNRPKSGLAMTVNTGRLRQSINNLPQHPLTWDHEGHEYVSRTVAAGQQEEKSFWKVLHANGT